MNWEQASRIVGHLRDAADALERASQSFSGFSKEEQLRPGNLLGKVMDILRSIVTLQSEVLAAAYAQRPDLEPPYEDQEIPVVNSELRWDQVHLPPSISEKDVDEIIFSVLKPSWQKVALVVGLAQRRCGEVGLTIANEAIAARLQALAESGLIEGFGDLRQWRFSEVRLTV
jgi:hypothetical protein